MIELLLSLLQEPSQPTWHDDIYPIMLMHCSECHGQNGAGPFELLTYESVANRATFIADLIDERLMPPWLPSKKGTPLRGERFLPEEQIDLFKQWINAGKLKGEGAEIAICPEEAKPPTVNSQTNPNIPWIIPSESGIRWHKGILDKRTFVLSFRNAQSLKVNKIQYKTTAQQAVQMVGFVFDGTGQGREVDSWDADPGYEMMGDIGWVPSGAHGKIGPGTGCISVPHGFYIDVPANADLIAETHYRPQGKEECLSSSVLLWETTNKDARKLLPIVTMIRRIVLESEAKNVTEGESIQLPHAVDVVGVTPRAGAECESMRLSAVLPDGNKEILLDIPKWNPHYGETFFFVKPIRLPEKSIITSSWTYNNSASNPRNPFVPSKKVDLARRTGIANFILHSAAVDSHNEKGIVDWNLHLLRKRQRATNK